MKRLMVWCLLAASGCERHVEDTRADVDEVRSLDYREFFATRAPSQFPEARLTPELSAAITDAVEHFRTITPSIELVPGSGSVYVDADRGLMYLTFNRTVPHMSDFYLVYVYEPKTGKLVGYVSVPTA